MKTHHTLAPTAYLKTVAKRRQRHVQHVMYGTTACLLFIITALTTTSYGHAFMSSIAFAEETDTELAYDEEAYYDAYNIITENGCNVLGLTVYGDIGTYDGGYAFTSSNHIRSMLDYVQDTAIKAVLVEVDSSGGSPVAGDEIMQLLAEQPVPVVASIRELGASAGYMSILSADRIFMHKYGTVGSIGIIYPHYDYTEKNKQDGIKYEPIQSAPMKDAGSPDRPMTEAERAAIQAEIDYLFDGFVDSVAMYRNLSRVAVLESATGATFMAPEALKRGLIDEVGGIQEVRKYLSEEIGEPAVVCWDYELGY